MEQVVMNLALNARDAMRGGGRLLIETKNVRIEASGLLCHGVELPVGDYVRLMVRDTGHGMSEEVKAHLFEPFFTTKAATQNSGLGLATVYGIVVQNGGHIAVESEPGQGASFLSMFPRADPDQPILDPAETRAATGGSETVLVVEDEDAVRQMTTRVLIQQGYTVLEAGNGSDGLALARRHHGPVHLLVTDVVMPEMGGLELAERVAEIRPGITVIYMSGYAEGDKLQPGIRDSNTPFLQKPFSAESLILRVREALDRAACATES
jgi:CheY-like chemotaxis protein